MKKTVQKLTAMLLAFALIFTCLPSIDTEAANYSNFYDGEYLTVTATHGVNMHEYPDVTSTRLMTLGYGHQLEVRTINYSTGWMSVTCGAYTGWVEGNEGWFAHYSATSSETTLYTYTNKQAMVQANALNVHRTPIKLSSNIMDDLYKGQVVDALGYTNTGWTKVSYKRNGSTYTGFVSSAWVTIQNKSATTEIESFSPLYGYSAKVNASALNMHASPSTSASIITDLYCGDVVTILAYSSHWYKVVSNVDDEIRTGYIYRSYVTRVDAMTNLRMSYTSRTLKVKKKWHLLVRGNTGMSIKTTWKSKNKKIATVNSKTGIVTAKKAGTTYIYCTVKVGSGSKARTKTLKCKIKVKK